MDITEKFLNSSNPVIYRLARARHSDITALKADLVWVLSEQCRPNGGGTPREIHATIDALVILVRCKVESCFVAANIQDRPALYMLLAQTREEIQ